MTLFSELLRFIVRFSAKLQKMLDLTEKFAKSSFTIINILGLLNRSSTK